MAGAALWFVAGLVLLALGGDSIVKGASGQSTGINMRMLCGLLIYTDTGARVGVGRID